MRMEERSWYRTGSQSILQGSNLFCLDYMTE